MKDDGHFFLPAAVIASQRALAFSKPLVMFDHKVIWRHLSLLNESTTRCSSGLKSREKTSYWFKSSGEWWRVEGCVCNDEIVMQKKR